MNGKVEVQGTREARFSSVKKAFADNSDGGHEVGASLAATIDGKYVIDVWGGFADAAGTRSWEGDTIVNVFSMTKIMTAVCAWMLARHSPMMFCAFRAQIANVNVAIPCLPRRL